MQKDLKKLSQLIRYYVLVSCTKAGSGHPTSCLSATDLMTTLFHAGFFKAKLDDPEYLNNDRLIFSKGHAAPLLYSLYFSLNQLSEGELFTLRKFKSNLEGHPTYRFKYTESATGSLGQGLGVGLGFALNAKYENLDYKTFVLLGDSEITEGSVWESMEIASYYQLNNLIAIVDVNGLGQRGPTTQGFNLQNYKKKSEAFGWESCVINGHNFSEISRTYENLLNSQDQRPKVIWAETKKGKGVSFLEDSENWHGKSLDQKKLEQALKELGEIDKSLIKDLTLGEPKSVCSASKNLVNKKEKSLLSKSYQLGEKISTREAYGDSLVQLGKKYQDLIVLDAETSNSTFAETFRKEFPARFFEMFIAEQNMASVALGFAKLKKKPFVSTFSAFLTRVHDQVRMAAYSKVPITFVGSHCGVSIGQDGSSQMGLEDLAMFRSILNSVVLYPADGNATKALSELAYLNLHNGISYLRTTRASTPIIYEQDETFEIGGSKTLKISLEDNITLVSAGITVFEALEAHKKLAQDNIFARVIDLYSIKPVDKETLIKAAQETKAIIVIEDHYKEGGLFEAVCSALSEINSQVYSLCVEKEPMSGKPDELLEYEKINKKAIVKKVKEILD